MTVHMALPEDLARAAAGVLGGAGVDVASHGGDPVRAAEIAAADADAIALIGPVRSAAVAEALEASAPAGLAMLAVAATWAGVTRDDEPGCDDPADHRATVLRLVARDTVVARRIAADVAARGLSATVVAGAHAYGRQLDGQLRAAGLRRPDDPADADVVVLAGLAGEPEVERARRLAPVPVIAFDGVQGDDLGADRAVRLALPYGPEESADGTFPLAALVRRAAALVVSALATGAHDRAAVLSALRRLGPFDDHGDPVDPPVWLWRADAGWRLTGERPLPAGPLSASGR